MLTEQECDAIRALPYSFNNMLRYVENKTRQDYLKFFEDIVKHNVCPTKQSFEKMLGECSTELSYELNEIEKTKGDLTAR